MSKENRPSHISITIPTAVMKVLWIITNTEALFYALLVFLKNKKQGVRLTERRQPIGVTPNMRV